MKIIKENLEENIPVSFLTGFVSKSWEEIGNIKQSIESLKKDFKNISEVNNILQDLSDAYLICIGRMEKLLNNENYIEAEPIKAADEFSDTSYNKEAEKPEEEEHVLIGEPEIATYTSELEPETNTEISNTDTLLDDEVPEVDNDDFIFSEDDFKVDDEEDQKDKQNSFIMDFDEPNAGEEISDADLEDLLKNI